MHTDQAALMRNDLRQLDRKSKRRRHTRGPALVSGLSMLIAKRRIDFGCIKHSGIAFERAAFGAKVTPLDARYIPAGAANVNNRRSHD